jgi:hypothetical protein
MPRRHGSPPLTYAVPEVVRRQGQVRVIGSISVLIGCLGLLINIFVAGAMTKQLSKQWAGVKGVSSLPIEPWLMTTATEAAISTALAAFAVAAGAIALRSPARGPSFHRWYAWVKLPLACVFAVCAGWFMTFYVSREPVVVAAAAALALLASAAYPLLLLRTLGPRRGTP